MAPGKLSRLAPKRNSLLRSQSAIEVGGSSSSQTSIADMINDSIPEASAHGIGTEMIKTFDHPSEPIRDQAVGCPLPEPSILNDGRLSKERMSAVNAQIRADLPVMKDGSTRSPSEQKSRPAKEKRLMLPSHSVPEHALLTMLQECNLAKD